MTPQLRNSFLVGAVSLAAIVGITLFLSWLNGSISSGNNIVVTALFKDAHGVSDGSRVELSGVEIGRIASVGLSAQNEAVVKVRLDKKYPVPSNSHFIVQTSALGNSSQLLITPGTTGAAPLKNGDVVRGEAATDLQDILNGGKGLAPSLQKTLETAQATLQTANATAKTVQKLIADPAQQRLIRSTLAHFNNISANLDATTESLPRLTRNAEGQLNGISGQTRQLLSSFNDAAVSGKRIAVNGEKLTTNLNGTLAENRATLKSLLQSADESASALAGLLTQAKGLLGDPKLRATLATTTDNLASITARLDNTAANIERLSGDPRLTADLRETVANLKDTTASVRNIAARVEGLRIPGEKRAPTPADPNAPAPRPRSAQTNALIEPGLAFDSFYDTTNPRFRADVDYTFDTKKKGRFYRAGLFDLTEGNHINLQLGQAFGGDGYNFAYRYGLVAGKFGLGFDTALGPFDLRLEGYDPNRFTTNARAKFYLDRARSQSLLFGVDDIAHDNRAVIGVQIRK